MPQHRPAPKAAGPVAASLSRTGIALAGIALAGFLAAVAPAPAAAQAGQACIDVNNTTDYWWPIRLRIGQGAPQQHRIDARTFGRLCMHGAQPADQPIAVSVRSSWLPVGECQLPSGGLVTISRTTDSDGQDVTNVECQPPKP